jgi:hypothetical protein
MLFMRSAVCEFEPTSTDVVGSFTGSGATVSLESNTGSLGTWNVPTPDPSNPRYWIVFMFGLVSAILV